MQTLSDYIQEIFIVIVFVGAITLLVFLSGTSTDIGRAVDDSSRNKTNVVEGISTVTSVEITGASVYYDVMTMITATEAVKIEIKDASGNVHTVRPNYTSDQIYKEFNKNNISTTLKSWLVMDGTYEKSYADDYDTTTGQIKTVTTIKYTYKS